MSGISGRGNISALVLIAGPDAGMRKQWRQGLQEKFAVQEVADRSALEASLLSTKPAVLLLDLALRRLSGVGDIPAVQKVSPSTKIILLTGAPNEKEGVYALKAGAKGYCEKGLPPALLCKAVEMVLTDQIWVGRNVVPHLLEELASLSARRLQDASAESFSQLESLTRRERAVACLVGDGASNKEIASRLSITEATVKAHLTAVFRKLGLSDRLRLALFMAEHDRE